MNGGEIVTTDLEEEHEQDLRAKRGADNKTLSAIRETQLDHGKKLDVIEVKLDSLGRGQGKLGRAARYRYGNGGAGVPGPRVRPAGGPARPGEDAAGGR
jgi:hypothetical protein